MIDELKSTFEKHNYAVSEPINNVLMVEDYLSKDELQWFLNLIKNTPENEWYVEYLSNLKPFCLEKFGRDDVDNLVAEGLFEITQGWEDKNLNFSNHEISKEITERLNKFIIKENVELNGFSSIQRMQFEVELKSHVDQDTDPSIEYASIIYLNDDYLNGELFFENKNISLKPNPGTLLLFPGNKEFKHGVKHVGDGPTRYVIVGFIKNKKYYKHDRSGNKINE